MAKKKRSPGVTEHHIFYQHTKEGNKRPSQREVTCLLTNAEHQMIWRIQNKRPENFSKGFWHALKVLMTAYEPFAQELKKEPADD